MTSVGLTYALTLFNMLRQLVELLDLEKLTLRSALPHAKALDVVAVPHSLQRLAYQSPTSFVHLVSPAQRYLSGGPIPVCSCRLDASTTATF